MKRFIGIIALALLCIAATPEPQDLAPTSSLTPTPTTEGTSAPRAPAKPADVVPIAWLPLVARSPLVLPACPPGVTVLGNHTAYVDSISYLNIVGEVCNNTASALQFISLHANVFDSGGHFLKTSLTYTIVNHVRPYTRACFKFSIQAPANWASYQFEGFEYRPYTGAFPDLALVDVNASYNTYWGWYDITGLVRNDGPQVNYVMPVATTYNPAGKVTGCSLTFVNSTNLANGQSSAFDLTMSGRNYNDVALYAIQVDGDIP